MRTNNVFFDVTKKLTLFLVFLVAAFGCNDEDDKKKEEAGISEVTLNGGRYSNVTAKTTTPAAGTFSPTENLTAITYTAEMGDESFIVIIAFPEQGPGQEAWNEETCFVSVMQYFEDDENSVMTSYLAEGGDVHSGFVKIDKYGPVGGVISGSFQGDVTIVDTECGCLEEGTIKGKFSAQRVQ